ncbi:hypothetical protein, partial [Xanthomonas hortorum]|uniref:hypothetical protein n=1 Tax=Xanthomonas hortorum TaxID=56454 RepID=UPI001F277814
GRGGGLAHGGTIVKARQSADSSSLRGDRPIDRAAWVGVAMVSAGGRAADVDGEVAGPAMTCSAAARHDSATPPRRNIALIIAGQLRIGI